ncbi:sensor histidine kinase [Winogradskyella sp. PG-2]|uniref:sensor histidine kinase n=1 Tax=Winogradskyella sp. PG-2 TaxID=754409 RepID=UPI000458637F|nr:PAS domain-containing sensor histidine kinase [Winogradskyella sp. PG-2]BAO75957.1 sensory transduction histidine kinase [Winogradskyella sp. PG-2]
MSQEEINILKRALKREKASRKAAEEILEAKSAELYEVNKKLEASHNELISLYNKTNSQLQGVFENIVDAYVIMDLWGNILKLNDAAVELLGFETTKDDGNLMNLVDPNDKDMITPSFKKLIEAGSITDFKITILTSKKTRKFIHINASIIYENDRAVAAQGIIRDITLEDKYQKALEAEKQKYSSIIANMNLGLVEFNSNDEIQMINQSFSEMSGYKEDELIGKTGWEMFPDDCGSDIIKKESKKHAKGESNSYEVKVKTKNRDTRYWLISEAPNYDLNGNIIGLIGIHLDITDLKSLQFQKESLLSKLEKSNDELQEYAHIVSHDLKSPLRSIDALIQWIKEDNKDQLNEVTLQNFAHIEGTLEKMEQLISDILDYSSIGSENNEKADVNTKELVNELVNILYVPDHIKISVTEDMPIVKGDKIKLQQLFQNLISNAVKFIDKQEGKIDINVKKLPNHFEFSITDNGMGIENQFHDKIFKIFHSLNNSKESTGIGLSIVKKIVDLHKGSIWLESEPGKGSTFYFTLKK